jgi:tetratricopeptide (TPR) repeat protein
VRLDPNRFINQNNLALSFLALNRRDEVKEVSRQILARSLPTSSASYLVAFLENDTKGMETQLAAISESDHAYSLMLQSGTEAYFGHLKRARDFNSRAVDTAHKQSLNESAAEFRDTQAFIEAEFGNHELARQTVAAALTISSGRLARLFAAMAFARAGEIGQAQALAEELNKRFPSDTLLQRYWLPTIHAATDLARKNPSSSLTALQDVSYELGSQPGGTNMYPTYIRAQAYLAAHQGKDAASEFQKILDHRHIALNAPWGALAHFGLGRAYLLQGDTAKARAAYQDFLALWKDADPDIPILKQAKAEYAKLQ